MSGGFFGAAIDRAAARLIALKLDARGSAEKKK
jgi:hypothetical protein